MIHRGIRRVLEKRLQAYPAVALVGPRQSGKTTLARAMGGVYYDLEQESDRLRLDLEWDARVAGRELIILDEPTRGIDIGARAEIEQLIHKLRADGIAVLLISSEIEEIVRNSTRVVVLRERRKTGEVVGAEIEPGRLMRAMAGGHETS